VVVAFVAAVKGTQAIPLKSNRKVPRDYDKTIYKERNLVERLFQKLKSFRRIATRYERLARHYKPCSAWSAQ
jgi:transposase